MYLTLLSIVSYGLVWSTRVTASPIYPRDNACTACRAILTHVNQTHPEPLYSCSATTAERVASFNTDVCDTFNATEPANPAGLGSYINLYCHALVEQFGTEDGPLFPAIEAGGDPATLCHEQFRSC